MHGSSKHYRIRRIGILVAVGLLLAASAGAARIKDIVEFKGVRTNQLVGYGLVVGLDGTGDGKKATFTVQSMVSMLEKMGITVSAGDIAVQNVAAVMVTAELPAFARAGSRIDITVSSIGDAENLQGGTLLFTPLRGADGRVYAVGQGSVSTGGFAAGGAAGSVQKNFPTVGRIVGGALIEREIPLVFNDREQLTLSLNRPDFTTAARLAAAINNAVLKKVARASDPGTVEVRIPEAFYGDVVGFVTRIENLNVAPDSAARVVINERTGTVIMGDHVRLSTVAIAHGNLSIQINESEAVSQPMPFSEGETVISPETSVAVEEDRAPLFLVDSGVDIGSVVKALNALGVSPRDLIAILQALKAAGALQADLEIM